MMPYYYYMGAKEGKLGGCVTGILIYGEISWGCAYK